MKKADRIAGGIAGAMARRSAKAPGRTWSAGLGSRELARLFSARRLQRRGRPSAVLQRTPDAAPGGADTGVLSSDERERYRIEVASRIGDVARKWSLAIGLAFTNEKTKPDTDLWGFVFEALFTFAGGILGRAAARWAGNKVFKLYEKRVVEKQASLQLREKAWELANHAGNRVEREFPKVHDALVEGAKEWLDDHASVSNQLETAEDVVATMSDVVGSWGQALRKQYILDLPASPEGDARLLAAVAAFDEANHPQADYNDKVAKLWRGYHDIVIPVLKGAKGFVDPRGGHGLANVSKDVRLRSPMYRLRAAMIVLPAYRAKRLAVVYEFRASTFGTQPGPFKSDVATGEYAFRKWVEPDLAPAIERTPAAWAEKRELGLQDLVNQADPELAHWFLGIGLGEALRE